MAWKVDEGAWNGVSLDGMGVALVVKAEGTLGDTGVFKLNAGKTKAVVLVDERATDEQHAALVAFVRDSARELATDIARVDRVPFELENDHLSGVGKFKAGKVAVLVGDWTRGDPAIGRFLAAHGRSGVPFYLFYPADGGAPQILPQILTPSLLAGLAISAP